MLPAGSVARWVWYWAPIGLVQTLWPLPSYFTRKPEPLVPAPAAKTFPRESSATSALSVEASELADALNWSSHWCSPPTARAEGRDGRRPETTTSATPAITARLGNGARLEEFARREGRRLDLRRV